jgi:adhesin HecA-like repeat protein
VDVEDLSEAERLLWAAFPRAQTVDLGGTGEVRAEVVAALLLGARPAESWRVPAVRLTGARVSGVLDLSFAEIRHAALLRACVFEAPVDLYGVRTRQLNLAGSRLPGLRASDAQIDGLLWLDDCEFAGPLELDGARVDGALSLRRARFATADLRADALTVARTLDATGHDVTGEVLLRGARVEGVFTLDRAHLANPGRVVLNADGIVLGDGLFGHDLAGDGEIRLPDARIGRQFVLSGARLHNPSGVALRADRMRVDGTVALDRGFRAQGEVSLRSATIGGTLLMHGARLGAPGGIALDAHLINVASSMRASQGFHADGQVYLEAAHIQGSADFNGARLTNPGGQVLSACRAQITGGLFCTRGFSAEGEIRLVDATIGASAEFGGARLSNPTGPALTARGLSVGTMLDCSDGFHAEGPMIFTGARVVTVARFDDAVISAPGQVALELREVRASVLRLTTRTPVDGTIDLRHTRVEVLWDDPARWPAHSMLDGFTYAAIETPGSVDVRLDWLDRTEGYHPQPYEQLATVYRAMGRDTEARTVQLERQRRRRRTLPFAARAWGYVQDWAVGYGYRPVRAGLWLVGLFLAGTAVFGAHHPAPLHSGEAPGFNPVLYTLDLLLPIIDFGQQSAFDPRGGQQWLAALLITAGWVLATTIAAGATRVLSRQ